MVGEGVVEGVVVVPEFGLEETSLAVSVIVSLAFLGLAASRFLEPVRAASRERVEYVVRWEASERRIYEGLGGVADVSEEGVNSRTVESLEAANWLGRLLERQLPEVRYATYSVRGRQVTRLKAWDGKPSETVVDPQAVWDSELTELAEDEAAASRDAIDKEWTAFRQRNLELTRRLKDVADVEIIGGESGAPPCRLCNGKGVREIFGKEEPCDWCEGTGIAR